MAKFYAKHTGQRIALTIIVSALSLGGCALGDPLSPIDDETDLETRRPGSDMATDDGPVDNATTPDMPNAMPDMRAPQPDMPDEDPDMGGGEPDQAPDMMQMASCQGVACGPDGQCVVGANGPDCVCDTDAVLVNGACHAGCPEHPNCRFWTFNQGTWTAERVDDLPDDITAAFDIETTDDAYVLTDSALYRLNIATGAVTSAGALTPLTGTLRFNTILSAFTIPASFTNKPAGQDSFQIFGLVAGVPHFSSGSYEAGTFTVGLQDSVDIPNFDDASIKAQWLDTENSDRWAPASTECPNATRPVSVLVTATRVHYSEASGGDCSGMSSSEALGLSPMFGVGSPPPLNRIEAAFYHDGKLSVLTTR